MKKTTSKLPLSKRLTQYGALTVSILAASEVSAQIEYTDVDPDFAGGMGLNFALDLNNDGTPDFNIYQNSGNDLYMLPYAANNEMLGSGLSVYPQYFYPFALNSGNIISASAAGSWANNGYSSGIYTSLNFGSCSYGNWCNIADGYLGLRFDIGGNIHYGWARLDVNNNGDVWTIKDYAYNTTPGEAIEAGQQVLSTDALQNKFANIACVDRIVIISQLQGDANYRILSITGQVVKEGVTKLETQNVSIESLSSGIYIVEVSAVDSSAVTRKKIAI